MADISDSYITTVADMEARLADDPRPLAIAFLDSDNPTWYLQKATAIIDSLYLKGSTYYYIDQIDPATGYQARQFPRVVNGRVCNWDYDANSELVPEEVKKATIEEALALYDEDNDADLILRRKLQKSGVSSVNFRGRSESYETGATRKWKGLHSQESYDLLKSYIAGAVRAMP